MVTALKRQTDERADLRSSAKEFLTIFTDAAQHIPKHRRTSFFAHLVNVLGPEDFLAPVCLLLVDKVAKRVVKDQAEDLKSTLSLPVSLLQEFPVGLQDSVSFTSWLPLTQANMCTFRSSSMCSERWCLWPIS
jgi:U3 small nucleolar RNA-associated protein 10